MIRSLVLASFMGLGMIQTAVVEAAEKKPEFLGEQPSRVLIECLSLDGDNSLYPHPLRFADCRVGLIVFDDGTKWQADVNDEAVRAELERWARGDWIGIYPPERHGSFQLENRSRGNGECVAVSLAGLEDPFPSDPLRSKPIAFVDFRGLHGLH